MLTPEKIIEIYGGPAVLNIKYMRIVMEANDQGKSLTYEEIIKELANQIGVQPIHVHNALLEFWDKEIPLDLVLCRSFSQQPRFY
jgi:hypothetical protein